jgi:LysR family transcriptional regulator (chromosome initiation inhibitor)
MLNRDWLATLTAIVDEGTFEAAAVRLRITPSAVSQRIRALEQAVGQVVVERSNPCRATEQGTVLLGAARAMAAVEAEALGRIGSAAARSIAVAVNADSLATWFVDVLRTAAGMDGVQLQLRVDDEAHTGELLRTGAVLGAVTTAPEPVPGCTVDYLGTMSYLPVCSPEFAARWRSGGRWRWREMPLVRFNAKDDLQHRVLRKAIGDPDARPPEHRVPSSEGFAEAVRAGLGWGSVPRLQLGDDLDTGRLVDLGRPEIGVRLHWQRWRLHTPALEWLTDAVHGAAAVQLT